MKSLVDAAMEIRFRNGEMKNPSERAGGGKGEQKVKVNLFDQFVYMQANLFRNFATYCAFFDALAALPSPWAARE